MRRVHTLPPPLLRLQNKNQQFISHSEMRQRNKVEMFLVFKAYDKSEREKMRLLFDFLIYKHVELHS